MKERLVPEDFLPVFNDAVDYYPLLGGKDGGGFPPFGYHATKNGAWACDGRRLHLNGELPDEDWAHLVEWGIDGYCTISCGQSAEVRQTLDRDPPVAVAITVDEGMGGDEFVGDDRYAEGEIPDGFRILGSYLLDAIDFIFGDEDGEFAVSYGQGVFEVSRSDGIWVDVDVPEGHPITFFNGVAIDWSKVWQPVDESHRCFIAGYQGFQWLLPLNQPSLRRTGTRELVPPGPGQPAGYRSELEARIAATYPFPLSYSYLLPMDAPNAMQESVALLRAGENLLAFLGSVLLALTAPADRPGLGLDPTRLWQTGIAPGAWLDTIRRAAKTLVASDQQVASTLAHCVLEVASKGGVRDGLDYLVRKKNDLKHDRAFGSEEASNHENPELWSTLDRTYEALAFLADHPLRLVYSLDISAEKQSYILECFSYQGAHPRSRKERHEWYEALTKNRLYLEVSAANWVPLYPFLHRDYCSTCGANELFYLDKLPGRGKAIMKSFERGHTVDVPEVASAVERWFAG